MVHVHTLKSSQNLLASKPLTIHEEDQESGTDPMRLNSARKVSTLCGIRFCRACQYIPLTLSGSPELISNLQISIQTPSNKQKKNKYVSDSPSAFYKNYTLILVFISLISYNLSFFYSKHPIIHLVTYPQSLGWFLYT